MGGLEKYSMKISIVMVYSCHWASGGIGIRAWLRTMSRKGWEFESPLAHRATRRAGERCAPARASWETRKADRCFASTQNREPG